MLESMPLYALSLVAMAGIAAFVALERFVFWLRRRDLHHELWFVFAAICYTGLALTEFLSSSANPITGFGLLKSAYWFKLLMHILLVAVMAGFVDSFTGTKDKKIRNLILAISGFAIVLHIAMPHGLFVQSFGEPYQRVLPWDERSSEVLISHNLFYAPYNAFVFLVGFWALHSAYGLWQTPRKRQALWLMIALVIIVIAVVFSILEDLGIGFGIDPIVPTLIVSLIPMMILVTDELAASKNLSARIELQNSEQEALSLSLRQKSQEAETLLSLISLDLRTPLVNVIGFSDDMRDTLNRGEQLIKNIVDNTDARHQCAQAFQDQLRPSLEYIRQGATKMRHMLDAVQLVTRLDRTPLHLGPCDILATLRITLDKMATDLEAAQVALDLHELPQCIADPALLCQVFEHLLGNSLRYRSPERRLCITVYPKLHPLGQHARWNIIGISDNGVGFEPNRAEQLFELFHREHRENGDDNIGIGLYLARRAIWRMNGEIWAEGQADVGATFWVALPPIRSATP